MQPETRSRTAEGAAFLRALHLCVDDAPFVFEDRAALDLVPPYGQRFLARMAQMSAPWRRLYRQRRDALTRMRSQVVVRSRYAEDALGAFAGGPERQCVVVAAGLDTVALRHPELRVFELDHPATQAWKRGRLDVAPDNLVFAPIDFEREAIGERLAAAGFDGSRPTFASWLGTTYYLSPEAVSATLSALRAVGVRELVLDHWSEPPARDLGGRALLAGTRVMTAFLQEPLRSVLAPGAMEHMAAAAGWRIREHCPPAVQNARYLEGRNDGLEVPSFSHLLHLEAEPARPMPGRRHG